MNVCGRDLKIKGRIVRTGRLAHEGFELLDDPEEAVAQLQKSPNGIDLFTFMPKLPHTTPRFKYAFELDNVAALPITTYDQWWTKQIDGKTRNMVRRGEKKGVTLREVTFDDAFAKGIWEIYNETPVRQGRLFPHYGKDFETVRNMSATFMDSSIFIGAYIGEQLIGFLKLTSDESRSQTAVMHIISMIQHRDKAPTNALIAYGVRACADRKIPYIVYSNFAYGNKQRDSLSDFKENNGFKRIDLPRYYVPLTAKGRIAFRLGLHRSLMERIPEPVIAKLREYRNRWYDRKFRDVEISKNLESPSQAAAQENMATPEKVAATTK